MAATSNQPDDEKQHDGTFGGADNSRMKLAGAITGILQGRGLTLTLSTDMRDILIGRYHEPEFT